MAYSFKPRKGLTDFRINRVTSLGLSIPIIR